MSFLRFQKRNPIEDWTAVVLDPEYVHKRVLTQMPSIVQRALQAGAVPPLTYMGAGMTAIVMCDQKGIAFKVGRPDAEERSLRSAGSFLSEEAEWLETARTVRDVKEHVARIYEYFPVLVVIKRECPIKIEEAWRFRDQEWDLHQKIRRLMLPHGWTAPEFKTDSYVVTLKGPILVDASMPSRVGHRLLRYLEDVLNRRRPIEFGDTPALLASTLQQEVSMGALTQAEAQPVIDRLLDCGDEF